MCFGIIGTYLRDEIKLTQGDEVEIKSLISPLTRYFTLDQVGLILLIFRVFSRTSDHLFFSKSLIWPFSRISECNDDEMIMSTANDLRICIATKISLDGVSSSHFIAVP